ncbi:MAG: CvpA family protein [Patescibacteria group bacterium]
MISLDLIALVILLVFVLQGLGRGFVASLTSVAGMVATFIIALFAHPALVALLESIGATVSVAMQLVLFFIVFLIVGRLLGYVVNIINNAFRVVSAIPFAKSIDRLLGGVFGLLEGLLIVVLLTGVLLSIPDLPLALRSAADASWIVRIATFVLGFGGIFIPDSWQNILP